MFMLLSVAVRQRIINLAKSKHISLLEVSRSANLPYTTIINFMRGEGNTITLTTLLKLCIGLKIELRDFFDSELFDDVLDEHEKEGIQF